jgi:ureidoacrylate peracid hydrolase
MSTPANTGWDRLDAERTCLLFFDMLNVYIKDEQRHIRDDYKPVIANAQRLLEAARRAGLMVAYVAANHRADNLTSARLITDTDNRLRPRDPAEPPPSRPNVAGGTWEAQVVDEIAPRPEDYIIPKYRWSAFFQTYLELALRTRGIDTIILSGGSTDVGVASTAYAARDLDYNLVIVSDACKSAEQDNHDQLMRRIFPRMARVRTTDQVVAMLSSR